MVGEREDAQTEEVMKTLIKAGSVVPCSVVYVQRKIG